MEDLRYIHSLMHQYRLELFGFLETHLHYKKKEELRVR
jgi:hypothetical protein